MLTRSDFEKYEYKAKRILTAIDKGPVPVNWSDMDEEDLITVIARELIRQDKERGMTNENHD